MFIFVRILMLLVFLVVIFGRSWFPNAALYWLTYALLSCLVVLYWFVTFWTSRKKAAEVIGSEPDFDIFAGRVMPDPTEDLHRGRLCIKDGFVYLVCKKNAKEYVVELKIPVKDIKSIGYGIVAGKRKGFTIYTSDGDYPFTSGKIAKRKEELYKALGWKFE